MPTEFPVGGCSCLCVSFRAQRACGIPSGNACGVTDENGAAALLRVANARKHDADDYGVHDHPHKGLQHQQPGTRPAWQDGDVAVPNGGLCDGRENDSVAKTVDR